MVSIPAQFFGNATKGVEAADPAYTRTLACARGGARSSTWASPVFAEGSAASSPATCTSLCMGIGANLSRLLGLVGTFTLATGRASHSALLTCVAACTHATVNAGT